MGRSQHTAVKHRMAGDLEEDGEIRNHNGKRIGIQRKDWDNVRTSILRVALFEIT